MKSVYKKSVIAIFWLILWEAGAMIAGSALLLPDPIDTIMALARLVTDADFWLDAGATIGRCLLAMAMALAAGALLSIAAYKWQWVRDVLSLPVAFFKAVPIMAVAIYIILLMSAGSVPVLVCWIMCFPIVYTNLLAGLDSMDVKLLEMSRVYDIKGGRLIRRIYMPSLYPHFRSAVSLVAGMSWKAVVTAEVLSIPKFSLGYELMNAKYYLTTDRLFAYVVVLIIISIAFEKLIKGLVTGLEPHSYKYSGFADYTAAQKAYTGIVNNGDVSEEGVNGIAQADTSPDEISLNSRCKSPGAVSLCGMYESPDAVSLRGVYKSFGDKAVLKDFCLDLKHGKITAVMGQSGLGKTTIARLIAGLETADAGTVEVDGKVSYLFQEDRLLPWFNVYDNLAVIGAEKEKIESVLAAVGLEADKWKLPGELSGGMSYRVAMARAFLRDADILIADEPFRGLDFETRHLVIERLWQPGTKNRTVLLITHSEEDARLADEIIKL